MEEVMQRRIHPFKNLFFVFFLLYLIWVLLLILAPVFLPTGTVTDLSGNSGYIDNEAVTGNLSFPWNMVYSIGDRLCHQKAERSLYLNGNEMPFCSRCTAIWLGLAFGMGCMVFYTIELNEKFFIAIILCILPLGIDGMGQLLGFWESSNILRILTGFPAGLVCGIALGVIYDELCSFHLFKKKETP
jgi:uncharacterized membrane protein